MDGNPSDTSTFRTGVRKTISPSLSALWPPLVRGKWFISYSIQSPDAMCQLCPNSRENILTFSIIKCSHSPVLWGILKARGVFLNPYGTSLMSDGFPMDRYGRSEKHISSAFTLKANTQLGREREGRNVSPALHPALLITSPHPFWLLSSPVRLLIKNSFKNSPSPSLAVPGRAVALVFSEYLHLRLCGKFANTNIYQHTRPPV